MPALGLAALALGGCTADLLPGERVLGAEIPAIEVRGEPLSELGAAVAVAGGLVLAGAPKAGFVRGYDASGGLLWEAAGEAGLGRAVWAEGEGGYAWRPGDGVYAVGPEGATRVLAAPEWTAVDRCPDGTWQGETSVGGAIRCGEEGVIRAACEGSQCAVTWESTPGEPGEDLGTSTPGSAVDWALGQPCWGDARVEETADPGRVRCADGTEIAGLDGDHLGAGLGGERAAGVFNKWQVPARARIVPLAGGEVWAVERAAERSRVAVAAADGLTVVGVPGFGASAATEGLLFLVQAP